MSVYNRGKTLMAKEWRRGRDSNPRYGFTPYNGLANPPVSNPKEPGIARNVDVSSLNTSRSARRSRELADSAEARESAQHDPRSGKPRKSLAQILDRYMVAPSGCWEWTGTRNEGGYGIVCLMLAGKPNTMPAPRLQWMRLKGQIPEGLDCLHTCDNPACINVEHLFLGAPRDNIHDMMSKGRHNFTGLKHSGASAQESAQPEGEANGPSV